MWKYHISDRLQRMGPGVERDAFAPLQRESLPTKTAYAAD